MKDYYFILGVARDDPPERIRDAYRELAKRFHPDVAGAQHAATFREIAEAYDTLSDAERRRGYDRALGRPPADASEPPPGRSRPHDPPVEPLAPPSPVFRVSWWEPWWDVLGWDPGSRRPRRLVRIPVRVDD